MTAKTAVEILDLRPATLAALCRGNVKLLPSFMVHDNDAWPWPESIRLDNRNRIHLRRATFLGVVTPQAPVRAGLWLGPDVQEFFLDLQPHHLQGSEDMAERGKREYQHSRKIVHADDAARMPGDQDYGEAPLPEPKRDENTEADRAAAKQADTSRVIRSTTLD